MSRKPNADSAETWERIVSATIELIHEHGLSSVSMRHVAKRSQTSLGGITYYFANREELLEACLEHSYARIADEVHGALARIMGGERWEVEVETFVRRLFRMSIEHRELTRMRVLTAMEKGQLPEGRRQRVLVPLIDGVAATFGGDANVIRELRLSSVSLELLVGRYALHTKDERAVFTGIEDDERATAAVEDHLVRICCEAFRGAFQS